ncbi:MAG: hypothetical protein CME06_17555 [Gemmatimonadetes bacterium]|nr:hypothetical protein [Gemmatimonadota bacterium]
MSFDLVSVFATLILPCAVLILFVRLAAAAVRQIGSKPKARKPASRPTPQPEPSRTEPLLKRASAIVEAQKEQEPEEKNDFRVSEWGTSVTMMREMFSTLSDELELPPEARERLEARLKALAAADEGEEQGEDEGDGGETPAEENDPFANGPISSLELNDDNPFDWPTHLIDHRPPS